jgi:lipid-A-disaccharide synthase
MPPKILISAGEVSGDQHIARVIRALKLRVPDCAVRGMAGRCSEEAGAALDLDCYKTGAGMGFLELLSSGGKVVSSFRRLSEILRAWQPDLLILVDYPDFNLRLARVAKRCGVPVLYFIPPKVWAWRSGRVRKISRYVDHVAAIFPFESEFYSQRGYTNVTYVGHPLGDRSQELSGSVERQERLLLLPGSRRFEVERLLVPMLRAYGSLRERHPNLKPVVVLAPNIDPLWVRGVIGDKINVDIVEAIIWSREDALAEMRLAKVGVLKSGTCNLEAAMAGLPFVCVYSGTLVAKVIVSLFVKLKEYSPVNIIRSGTVQELMQLNLKDSDVVSCVEPLIAEGGARADLESGLAAVREALIKADGDEQGLSVASRVANLALSMM